MDFLSDFGVQPILLAAQAVNFLVLLFILNKFLYKPVLKTLDQRKQKVSQSLKAAHDIQLMVNKSNTQISLEKDRLNQEIKAELADMIAAGLKVISGKVLS